MLYLLASLALIRECLRLFLLRMRSSANSAKAAATRSRQRRAKTPARSTMDHRTSWEEQLGVLVHGVAHFLGPFASTQTWGAQPFNAPRGQDGHGVFYYVKLWSREPFPTRKRMRLGLALSKMFEKGLYRTSDLIPGKWSLLMFCKFPGKKPFTGKKTLLP